MSDDQDQFPMEDPDAIFWEVMLEVRRMVAMDRARETGKPW